MRPIATSPSTRAAPWRGLARACVVVGAVGCGGGPDAEDAADGPDAPDPVDETATGDASDPAEVGSDPGATAFMTRPYVCAAPEEQVVRGPFRIVSAPPDPVRRPWFGSMGGAVADFDGDGFLDAFLPGEEVSRLFFWRQGQLVEARDALERIDLARATGAVAVDLDGDGDQDLFVLRWGLSDVVLRNDGYGRFVDDSAAFGDLTTGAWRGASASFADPDRDGDLDAFVAGYGELDLSGPEVSTFGPGDPSRLFENQGGGRFVERTDRLDDLGRDGWSFLGGWTDLDDDGGWELYIPNDFGGELVPNRWYRFDDWTFTPVEGVHGLDLAIYAMGTAIGDIDEDGLYDVFFTSWNALHLLRSVDGRPAWFDTTTIDGVLETKTTWRSYVGWGAAAADIDNDTRLDLLVGFGFLDSLGRWYNPSIQPDMLLLQLAPGVFTNVAEWTRFGDARSTRGLVPADFDRDGWIDVLKPSQDGPDLLYQSRCGAYAWMELAFVTPGENTRGIGTRVIVRDGHRRWMGTVRAGGDLLASGGPPELHFGLGSRARVDSVEIRWPDGAVDVLHDVPTRRFLAVRQDRSADDRDGPVGVVPLRLSEQPLFEARRP